MSRYIDADEFENQVALQAAAGTIDTLQAEAMCKIIDLQPTADVQPVRNAHWEPYNRNGSIEYRCSFCNYGWKNKWKDYYCPHCGANMDESVTE